MLRFFRTLRQRLLTENKFSKYLLYAFGEIILVVIGILLALQVNNWNEDRKVKMKEKSYLQRFQQELGLNLNEMDRLIQQSDDVLVKIDSLMALHFGEIPPVSHKTFNQLAKNSVDYLVYQSAEATIEDLIGSGELDIIEDAQIRESIATWKSGLMNIRYLETDNKKAFNDLLEYYRTHSEIYKMMRDRPIFGQNTQNQVLSDPLFLNTLTYHAIPLQMLNGEYRNKKKEYLQLSDRVQKELLRLGD
jgi:hypothetical protein